MPASVQRFRFSPNSGFQGNRRNSWLSPPPLGGFSRFILPGTRTSSARWHKLSLTPRAHSTNAVAGADECRLGADHRPYWIALGTAGWAAPGPKHAGPILASRANRPSIEFGIHLFGLARPIRTTVFFFTPHGPRSLLGPFDVNHACVTQGESFPVSMRSDCAGMLCLNTCGFPSEFVGKPCSRITFTTPQI